MMARFLIALVRFYRLFFRAWLGAACRFEPTCSGYAMEALQHHGASYGTYLTLGRLVRCHPWCDGGSDPVPVKGTKVFSRLLAPTSENNSS